MVNAVCNNIRRARKPSVTSELAVSLGLEVRHGLYVIRCVRVVSSTGLNLAKLGLLVKMDIGGRRLKAVCVVESQEGTSGVSRGASAPRPNPSSAICDLYYAKSRQVLAIHCRCETCVHGC